MVRSKLVYLQRCSSDDLSSFGLILNKSVNLVDGSIEGDDLEAVVVHVQDDVLQNYNKTGFKSV